ncbi:MAG: CocE/NonD family hydrolase, partial [Halioglobus sp.]|nr:CocE/NonD family hydrolase [Halioglobus sp.]
MRNSIIRLCIALTIFTGLAACGTLPAPESRVVFIPMPDGVQLAADLYLPTSGSAPYPVLLEYLPYRRVESRARNLSLYSYFLERGYAVARVDIRGTGNSEGRLIPYEYSEQELDDGVVVIDWLARQEWSSGNVGVFGISWGGFNAIQLAGRNPLALKAFIAVDATEDLYQEDVHYIDGILHVDSWLMSQEVDNARPGAPDYLIDDEYFRNRFDTEPWTLRYLRHQRYDRFWNRKSIDRLYERIKIPSLHIGGWYDGYRDSVPRMLEKLNAPAKAIVGPWTHAFPHEPWPNPGMEWREEAVQFLDHWLRGIDNDYHDAPQLAVYVRDWHAPKPDLDYVNGHWRNVDSWPPAYAETLTLRARRDHSLAASAMDSAVHSLEYLASSGIEAGGPVMWWGDVAPDQRPTDAQSLVYDSEPLTKAVEILGLPMAHLEVAANARQANWFVRLSDVAPDGQVTLITGAGFNGTHRDSASEPSFIRVGEFFPLDIELHFTSWVFAEGHRIRVSIGNAQLPMFWPTPYTMTTQLRVGGELGARIALPLISPGPETAPEFLPPASGPELAGYVTLDSGNASGYGEVSEIKRDPVTG